MRRARNLFSILGITNTFSRSDAQTHRATKGQRFTKRQLDFCHGSTERVFASSTSKDCSLSSMKPSPLIQKQEVRIAYSQCPPKKTYILSGFKRKRDCDSNAGIADSPLVGGSTERIFTKRHTTNATICKAIFQKVYSRIITNFHRKVFFGKIQESLFPGYGIALRLRKILMALRTCS